MSYKVPIKTLCFEVYTRKTMDKTEQTGISLLKVSSTTSPNQKSVSRECKFVGVVNVSQTPIRVTWRLQYIQAIGTEADN